MNGILFFQGVKTDLKKLFGAKSFQFSSGQYKYLINTPLT